MKDVILLVGVFAAIILFLATGIMALVMLRHRQRRPPKVSDPTLDSVLKLLAKGVLIENAAAIIGVIVLFANAAPPPPPPLPVAKQVSVRVPVADAVFDPVDTKTLQVGHDGFFKLEPGETAAFASAVPSRWTNDPLNAIDAVLSEVPIVWDFTPYLTKYEEMGRDDAQFIEKHVREQFEQLVEMKLASNRDSKEGKSVEDGIKQYFALEFVPILKDPSRRIGGTNQVKIDARPPGSPMGDKISLARRQVWKRIIAAHIQQSPKRESLFGPYTTVDATGKSPPPPGSGNKPFPSNEAPTGSLVAAAFRLKTDGSLEPATTVRSFYDSTHTITNDSRETWWIRLGINDDIPEDNGPGYADVVVTIQE